MLRIRSLLLLTLLAVVENGCSSTATTPSANDIDSNGQKVSSVPWNKPESWESNGQLGAMGQ